MNILVTGGAGFMGSDFIRLIIESYPNYKVINYDKLTYAGNLDNLRDVEMDPNYKFILGDICDAKRVDEVIKRNKITHIVNFAAETHVDRSIDNSEVFIKTNVLGTQVLLQAALDNSIERYHQISTDEIYGELPLNSKTKFNLKTPYDPRSPYSASKAAADHLVNSYFATFGLPVTISNSSNNYGPHQHSEKFIPRSITNLLENQKIPIYGDGEYVRDWLYVRDHSRAIDAILHNGKMGSTYLLGGQKTKEVNNLKVAETILAATGMDKAMLQRVTDRPGHDRRYAVDWSETEKELGWKPIHDFKSGMAETVNWYKQNAWWWKEQKREAEKFYAKKESVEKVSAMKLDKNKTILIFGKGQIGTMYQNYFGKKGYKVILTGTDITDKSAVLNQIKRTKADFVINTAGKTNLEWIDSNKLESFNVNALGTNNIAEACEELGVFFLHLSSGCIFESDSPEDSKKEEDIPNPRAFYSKTKVWAEELILSKKNLDYLILRPRQPVSSEVSEKNMLVKMLTFSAFIGEEGGWNSGTVLEDMMETTEALLKKGITGVLHVANDGYTTPYKIGLLLKKYINPNMNFKKITHAELDEMTPVKRVATILDVSKLKKLGIQVENYEKRLEEIIITLKENLEKKGALKILQKTEATTKQRATPNKSWKEIFK